MVAGRSELQSWYRRAERLAEEGADCITAGFPCQDISFAGAGAGLAGARSGLVWPLMRTIRLVRPRIALLENVAALLNRGLGDILGHMATVGYDAEWHCIPASAVGAPHRRDRIWIVATDADGNGQHARAGHAEVAGAPEHASDASCLHWSAIQRRKQDGASACGRGVADADSKPRHQGRPDHAAQGTRRRNSDRGGSSTVVCNPDRQGLAVGEGIGRDAREEFAPALGTGWWVSEPDVGRVADGVSSRVDRLRCLGNSVVPIIPEFIAETVIKAKGLTPSSPYSKSSAHWRPRW